MHAAIQCMTFTDIVSYERLQRALIWRLYSGLLRLGNKNADVVRKMDDKA